METVKTLFLIRHAKSSWDDTSLDDRERPLNKRGKRDAPRMGRRLAERAVRPDLVLTSPAVRARTTAETIAVEIGYPVAGIREDDRIYESYPSLLIQVVAALPDDVATVMLFGHNPSMTDLANGLAGEHLENVPTCGVVEIDLPVDHWADIGAIVGRLVSFDFPKRLSD